MSLVSLFPTLKPTVNMEFYIAVFSSLPFPLSEKLAEPPMHTALTNNRSYSPIEWLQFVRENDPDNQYLVTAVEHYKEPSAWPDCQHEYLILSVQLRPHPHRSIPTDPNTFLIKVSRTIVGHTLPARLGLWGPAADTITTVPGDVPHQHQRLHSLTWEIETAPALVTISSLICEIHDRMPRYRLLQSSCYAFARAVGRLIYLRRDGTAGDPQHTPFLIRESYLLHCIPAGITRAERVAVEVSRSCETLGGSVIFTFI